MMTVNGKLINQELNKFDELTQITEIINQRCEYLESQVTAISRQNYTQYLQNISHEVNISQAHLQKLEQRIGFLEELTSKQAKQLFFLKITSVLAFIGLWLIVGMKNKPEDNSIKPLKKAESLELIQPKSRNELLLNI
ncbi:hypothetical protein [Nostoc sp. MG11]|uniref:hypothetical protein n=1 Tax=Nostoc sp. MG11 TaxID=2721166 RepID=UPI0018663250|nr:hypothetical protein [Nostoc sp. MG11]